MTKSRLKPKDPEKLYYGIGKTIGNFYGHCSHLADLIADIWLAEEFYTLSRKELKGDFEHNWLK